MLCITCGAEFEYAPRQKYCTPDCRPNSSSKHTNRNKARAKAAEDHDLEFIAVDGEGITYLTADDEYYDEEADAWLPDVQKNHAYVLLSVGDKSFHRDGAKLSHDDCFRFLYDCFLEKPKAVYVGFFLGYDFSQWLQTIPDYAGYKLFHKQGIAERAPQPDSARAMPFPVYVKNEGAAKAQWECDILGIKRFKLRPHVPKSEWPECQVAHKTPAQIEACLAGEHRKHPHRWMVICDAGSFFQTSFLKAIDPAGWDAKPLVTPDEFEKLTVGKEARSTARFDLDMIEYNVLENQVLSRLMTLLNEGFVRDGIKLPAAKWFGPGQAAQAWMKLIGVPTGEEVREAVPEWALTAAQNTYYGGWFEVFVHGPIPGTTYAYDINSAYPHAIAQLPCLLHGEWSHGFKRPSKLQRGAYRMVKAKIEGKQHWPAKNSDVVIGSMPHRTPDGHILRPLNTYGWYWQHEIDASRRAGLIGKVTVEEWVDYQPCNCPPPIAAIADMYEARLRDGKNTPIGKSRKLVINSAYGKLAQSIGKPVFANAIYASLITAHCRTMILDAIATHPVGIRDVVMIATDGIVFLSPHTMETSATELGGWDAGTHENLSTLMPGLYWDDKSRDSIANGLIPNLKSRGAPAKALGPMIDQFDAQWTENRESITPGDGDHIMFGEDDILNTKCPTIELTIEFSVVSPKLATTRNDWSLCGLIQWDTKREISADWSSKRRDMYRDAENPDLLRTYAYGSATPFETTYYDKRFGMEIAERTALDEVLTPEGDALGIAVRDTMS